MRRRTPSPRAGKPGVDLGAPPPPGPSVRGGARSWAMGLDHAMPWGSTRGVNSPGYVCELPGISL